MMTMLRRRGMLGGFAGACCAGLAGCATPRVTLAQVLAPAQGRLARHDGSPRPVSTILAEAGAQPVTLTFGYVGCGGQVPLLERLRAATASVVRAPAYLLILNAIDEPYRYGAMLRDVFGQAQHLLPGERLEIAFLAKDELWARQSSHTVLAMQRAMHVRMGQDAFLQSVKEAAVFDGDGTFTGVRFL